MKSCCKSKSSMSKMTRDRIADDQMVALALAKLAIERPGWFATLQGLAEDREMLEYFQAFHKVHREK